MSAAAAADAVEVPRKKGGKKLVLILAIVGLLLAVAGGGAVFVMKRNAAAAEELSTTAEAMSAQTRALQELVTAFRQKESHGDAGVPLDPSRGDVWGPDVVLAGGSGRLAEGVTVGASTGAGGNGKLASSVSDRNFERF